ncbi:MAG: hypothetical protein WCY88_07895 [Spongiibacteraceae bacterium]
MGNRKDCKSVNAEFKEETKVTNMPVAEQEVAQAELVVQPEAQWLDWQ